MFCRAKRIRHYFKTVKLTQNSKSFSREYIKLLSDKRSGSTNSLILMCLVKYHILIFYRNNLIHIAYFLFKYSCSLLLYYWYTYIFPPDNFLKMKKIPNIYSFWVLPVSFIWPKGINYLKWYGLFICRSHYWQW